MEYPGLRKTDIQLTWRNSGHIPEKDDESEILNYQRARRKLMIRSIEELWGKPRRSGDYADPSQPHPHLRPRCRER
jgi:hypothetical protein